MHFADSIVIFLLALVLFGPKRLPEIGRQIGKLLVEFRRASNDFKMQIDEELRNMEQQERQKKLEAAAAASAPQTPLTLPEITTQPTILPPSAGETVSSSAPYASVTPPELPEPSFTGEPAPTESEITASAPTETPQLEAPPLEPHRNGHTPLSEQEPANAQAPINHG